MVKASPQSNNRKIASAALKLVGARGWSNVTLDDVAKATKIPLATLNKSFNGTSELVGPIAEAIDTEAFGNSPKPLKGKVSGTPHDVLFDLLMSRFDVMQIHRQAILSMASAAISDRSLVKALACATLDSVYRMIDISGIEAPRRPALAVGLGAIYGYAYFVWRKDETRDMAKTMAAIDRALRHAGKAIGFFPFSSRI